MPSVTAFAGSEGVFPWKGRCVSSVKHRTILEIAPHRIHHLWKVYMLDGMDWCKTFSLVAWQVGSFRMCLQRNCGSNLTRLFKKANATRRVRSFGRVEWSSRLSALSMVLLQACFSIQRPSLYVVLERHPLLIRQRKATAPKEITRLYLCVNNPI